MPLVLAPRIQKLLAYFFEINVEYVERRHQDGLKISTSSYEAFDEEFFQLYENAPRSD